MQAKPFILSYRLANFIRKIKVNVEVILTTNVIGSQNKVSK